MRTKITWAVLFVMLGIAALLLVKGNTLAAWLTGVAGFTISAAIARNG